MLKTLSLRNARRQAKDYLIYFITMVISVSLLYAFNNLIFSEEIKALSGFMDSLSLIIVAASIVIIIIIGWLVYYMTGFMLKKRSRELGTYMLMGIENKQVAALFFIENTVIGGAALLIGLIFGNLLYQVLKALIFNAYGFSYSFTASLSIRSILLTLVYAILIYLFALTKSKKRIANMKIYDLIYFEKQNEHLIVKKRRSSKRIFILSCLCGIISFSIFAYLPSLPLGSSISGYCLIAAVLGIIFLYGFYVSIPAFIISFFQKNRTRKYQKDTMFLFRTYTSKISSMSMVVSTLALLFTVTIVTMGFGMIMDTMMKSQFSTQTVYDLSVSHEGSETYSFAPYEEYADRHIDYTDSYIYTVYTSKNNTIYGQIETDDEFAGERQDYYMKKSDYDTLRSLLGYEKAESLDGQFLIHCLETSEKKAKTFSKQANAIDLNGTALTCAGIYTEPFDQYRFLGNGERILIVVPDAYISGLSVSHQVYALIAAETIPLEHTAAFEQISSDLSLEDDEIADLDDLDEDEYDDEPIYDYPYDYVLSIAGTKDQNAAIYVMIVIPLFYVAFILMITAITILATQQLSDASKYKSQYKMLQNLGMDNLQISKTIGRQLLIYFAMPILPPLLFGSVIIRSFGKAVGDGTIYTFSNMAACLGISIGIFLFIYGIYYVTSYVSFKRAVLAES